jgi:hypothetical protein
MKRLSIKNAERKKKREQQLKVDAYEASSDGSSSNLSRAVSDNQAKAKKKQREESKTPAGDDYISETSNFNKEIDGKASGAEENHYENSDEEEPEIPRKYPVTAVHKVDSLITGENQEG